LAKRMLRLMFATRPIVVSTPSSVARLGDGQAAACGQPAGESEKRLWPLVRAFAGMRGADAAVTQRQPAESTRPLEDYT